MGKTAHRAILTGAVLVFLFCFVAVVYAVWLLLGGGLVAGEIARLKAEGEPVCSSDLSRRHIPDSQNAAVIYDQIFKRLPGSRSRRGLRSLGRFMRRGNVENTPDSWVSISRIVAQSSDALALLPEALARPKCCFPVNWTVGVNNSVDFPHCQGLRVLAQILGAKALLDAKQGLMDRAVVDVEEGVQVTESLRDEPALTPQFTRASIIRTDCRVLSNILRYGRISDAQAGRLYYTLARVDLQVGT